MLPDFGGLEAGVAVTAGLGEAKRLAAGVRRGVGLGDPLGAAFGVRGAGVADVPLVDGVEVPDVAEAGLVGDVGDAPGSADGVVLGGDAGPGIAVGVGVGVGGGVGVGAGLEMSTQVCSVPPNPPISLSNSSTRACHFTRSGGPGCSSALLGKKM